MAEYLVLDVDATRRRVALLDRFRGYHVALVADELPPMGVLLQGSPAARGVALLHDPARGQVYRFTIEAIDCGQEATFQWLHPESHPPDGPIGGPRPIREVRA